ncbi:ABC transporter substrate-binding protein [Streptomyces sp. MUM 136J]|uniref:ABC transporter substrate-binding protein n=1 Tax=Streptomyces sp. MUM 136J TaxID=2791992 RepID=UPI001F04EF85|nr:ABC transporter substrate-binding protein [Streptomyces sp. MUM 136J]MCH0569919.1 ABC transporter substrate-binding protein [Streptomyces sp. MUM 136J]
MSDLVGGASFKPRPRRYRKPLLLSAGVVLVVLAAWLIVALPDRLDCGGSQLTRHGGECVGVTDGSFVFVPDGADDLGKRFRDIQKLIKKENDRVAAEEKNYVKVGLLSTLTPTDTGPQSPRRVLHSLEGAYTAQMRANHTQELGDRAPQVQLLLANAGSRYEHWEPAVDQLISMTDDSAPLVAVAGLSISTTDTQAAAKRLSEHRIPIIASSASADGLNASTIPGLIRVTGSNTDFVSALRHYVRDHDNLSKAILVADDDPPDLYVATLTDAFEKLMKRELGSRPVQPFHGTTIEEDAPPALVDTAVRNICQAHVDMVLFSGRTGDLDKFVEALHHRTCRPDPISVLFVETGPAIAKDEWARLGQDGITVVQASAMDPAWTRDSGTGPGAPRGFHDFYEQYRTRIRYADDVEDALQDGYAVANHDALVTAVRAIRISYSEDPEQPMNQVRVRNALFLLNLDNEVEAASGTLSFASGRNGDPGKKPIPVIETPPGPDRPSLYTTPEL